MAGSEKTGRKEIKKERVKDWMNDRKDKRKKRREKGEKGKKKKKLKEEKKNQ